MRGGAVAAAAGVLLLLTGCTATGTAGVQAAPSTSAAATPARTPDADLARFEGAARRVVAAHDDPGGQDFLRALEAAGWHRGQLQVTADRTSVGLDVPAVQFSALEDGSCLIGQYGGAGLVVLRADPVDGACLIGGTGGPG